MWVVYIPSSQEQPDWRSGHVSYSCAGWSWRPETWISLMLMPTAQRNPLSFHMTLQNLAGSAKTKVVGLFSFQITRPTLYFISKMFRYTKFILPYSCRRRDEDTAAIRVSNLSENVQDNDLQVGMPYLNKTSLNFELFLINHIEFTVYPVYIMVSRWLSPDF